MKQTIFSGIQATGIPQLGNFLGAIKHWERLSADYNCFYCVVDLHSITVRQDPAKLRQASREMLAWLIALGLDPAKCTLYLQSQVPAHAELSWILNCFTYMGELSRMTQFKSKSAKHEENINVGLFSYPVLQTADIVLFQANLVPIGDDQRQHLELARDVAGRFNAVYGDVFAIPDAYVPPVGARIMSLQAPDKKMSKSDENVNNCVFLSDSPDVVIKKFKRAVTDSLGVVKASPGQPGVTNLLTIYSSVTGKTIAACEAEFEGMGYGHFKTAVGEAVVSMFRPYQEKHAQLMADVPYLDKIIAEGAAKAAAAAAPTLAKVKEAVGFVV
ncbi:MAG: tryptophan--tRNA ligase [Defluviitaleaceae bacterium]|nr:tryptophan--tRNA ligase [Defluviitaleaceae bacterium]